MKYYSPSKKGFYDRDFHGNNIPDDVIEITDEHHSQLLDKQSEGYNIVFDGTSVVTEKAIPTEEELANAYKHKRISEYPDIGDQLDMLWHGMDSGAFPKLDSFYEAIKSIKDKYPKG